MESLASKKQVPETIRFARRTVFENKRKRFEMVIGNGNLFDHSKEAHSLPMKKKNSTRWPSLRYEAPAIP
jgi:hypothetical protein